MTKIFTENDLIRYIYGETSKAESLAIENTLLCDESLQEEYQAIFNIVQQLSKSSVSPSQKSVDRIIDYAKSYKLPSVM